MLSIASLQLGAAALACRMPFPQHPHCLNELVAPPRLANPARAAAAFLQACRPQALIAPQPHVEGGTAHAPVPASEAYAPTMLFVPPDPPESLTRSFRQRSWLSSPRLVCLLRQQSRYRSCPRDHRSVYLHRHSSLESLHAYCGVSGCI